MMLGLSRTTSMVVIRPLMPAGPILRGFRFLNCSRLAFCAVANKQIKALHVHSRSIFLMERIDLTFKAIEKYWPKRFCLSVFHVQNVDNILQAHRMVSLESMSRYSMEQTVDSRAFARVGAKLVPQTV